MQFKKVTFMVDEYELHLLLDAILTKQMREHVLARNTKGKNDELYHDHKIKEASLKLIRNEIKDSFYETGPKFRFKEGDLVMYGNEPCIVKEMQDYPVLQGGFNIFCKCLLLNAAGEETETVFISDQDYLIPVSLADMFIILDEKYCKE